MGKAARSGLLGLILVVAALVLSTPAATATATVSRPAVGQCRNLTPRQVEATSSTTAPKPCAQSHTARTIAVKNLPHGTSWSVLKHPASMADLASRLCMPAFRLMVGSTYSVRDRTAYTFVYFAPTRSQRAHGARWLRCDLVLLAGNALAPLPTDHKPALHGATGDDVARCLTSAGHATTCSRAHAYRALATFSPDRRTYPTAHQMRTAAAAHCPALVHSKAFFYTYPPKQSWQHGDRLIVCYLPTSD